jgi:hypothetical protein
MHFLLCGIYVRSILHGLLILNSAFHTAKIHFMSYEINIINVLSLCTFDALLCSALISFVGTDERNRGRRMTRLIPGASIKPTMAVDGDHMVGGAAS